MLTKELAKLCGWKENGRYDAVVVGAGSAGVGAAIAAARRGMRVALIESYGFAGGVATKSCVPLYFGFGIDGKQSTAGLSEEFIRRMDEVGAASFITSKDCAFPEFRPIAGRPLTKRIQLHPETMKLMHRRMLEEAGVECIFYAQMVDAVTDGDRIEALLVNFLEGPGLVYADYFIDCTGDALMFRQAGVPVNKYAEEDGMHKSMFFFVGGVTPFDHDYNSQLYLEARAAGRLPEKVWHYFGYSLSLNPGVVNVAVCYNEGDALNSRDMSRMDGEMRENVFAIVDYLRKEMPGFSRCYLLETAAHVGVRVGQGIVGMDSVSKELIAAGMATDTPVALINRSYGAHANSSKTFMATWSHSSSGFSAVPMGALVSPSLSNALAAGRCISADPHTVATFRMMNTCMTLGEAAGIMASLGGDMRTLAYARLRPELDKAGFILEEK
ncbi:MAG: FAD-dependent oxidoreductase [Ruminococcaceae bacterium]|nr:FAD-dependent oxidoreductase [Oscillospiraceae bacterium]